MSVNPDHIDFLMARDAEIRDGAEATLCAVVRMRDYIREHGLQVKAFFGAVKKLDGVSITLHWSADTWEARMSNAMKVLTTFESKDAPGWVSAITALHAWNDDRVANGERETWSLQAIYAACGGKSNAGKPAASKPAETPAAPVEVVAEPAPTTDQLSVILAALPNLTVAELATLAAAVGQERTRKASLVVVAA